MRVLVVGREPATHPVVTALSAAGTLVEAAPPEAAVARLALAPDCFALVLVERQCDVFADRRLYDAVRETGATAPTLFLSPPPPADCAVPPMCAIEQAPEGTRLLRCALAHARSGADAAAGAVGDQPHVFAYCAPVRRRD